MRTIKRLHSLEMPKISHQRQFDHLYKLIKPQRHDISIRHIGFPNILLHPKSLFFIPIQKTKAKSLEPNIIKLLRNSFKIEHLVVYYPTGDKFRIGIGRIQHQLMLLVKTERDPRLLFELDAMMKFLPCIQPIKLELYQRIDSFSSSNILGCRNILANTTMLKLRLHKIEDAAQLLSNNGRQFARLTTLSLEPLSDQQDPVYLGLSKALTLLPNLENLDLIIKSFPDFIKHFTIPLTLKSVSLGFSYCNMSEYTPLNSEHPAENDDDIWKFYAQWENLPSLRSLTCTFTEEQILLAQRFLPPLLKKIKLLTRFEFESARPFSFERPPALKMEASFFLDMIDHLTPTLETLILNHYLFESFQDDSPALTFEPSLSKRFPLLHNLSIGNMYLTSHNVKVLEDILQMVQGGSIKLSRIYLDKAESFQKLLGVLRKAEIPKDVYVSLNIDLKDFSEAADVLLEELVKLLSKGGSNLRRVTLNLWINKSISHILEKYMGENGTQSVLERFELTIYEDQRDISSKVIWDWNKRSKQG